MSAYRYQRSEHRDRPRGWHVYEETGSMTVREDDGTRSRRVLVSTLCRDSYRASWCERAAVPVLYPPLAGGVPGEGWCRACVEAMTSRDAPDPEAGGLLAMLGVTS
ncbi:hypothetical protein [Actinomyces faecalis]|uniref:hypothetical protein n=1 Tax=Actinomyces faecalis TaxID=2722820 RepID=UPI001557C6DC|nr:hypothetical protein [Actinomyces faecalis]